MEEEEGRYLPENVVEVSHIPLSALMIVPNRQFQIIYRILEVSGSALQLC